MGITGLNLLGAAAADMSAILARVDAAQATADNARQMVTNRDAKLNQASTDATTAVAQYTTLDALSQSYVNALSVSQADRAALHAQLDALAAQLALVQSATNLAVTARPVGALLLGATTTLAMPLSHPMPDTNYQTQFTHSAVVDLANVAITVTAKTKTTVTITVKSVGLALVAGTVIGVCW